MRKIRLGVNIDHVATLRNARNENFPNLLDVSKIKSARYNKNSFSLLSLQTYQSIIFFF